MDRLKNKDRILVNTCFKFYLGKLFPHIFNSLIVKDDILYCNVKKEYLSFFLAFLKQHTFADFKQLMDIWGVDLFKGKDRFEVNYMLNSLKYNFRLIVRITTDAEESVDSVVSIYRSAGWLERETYDMFGVIFNENGDLRRILTDYGSEGHPLRKDFPVNGYGEIRFDHELKRIVFEPSGFIEESRTFNMLKDWIAEE